MYRILAFRQKDVKKLFEELEKFTNVQLVSRRTLEETSARESFILSPRSLLGELTKKQTNALMPAIVSGYYDIPKKLSTDDIAKSLDLPRTTYEEHLGKAESKVMKAVAPLSELTSFSETSRKKPASLKAANAAANRVTKVFSFRTGPYRESLPICGAVATLN